MKKRNNKILSEKSLKRLIKKDKKNYKIILCHGVFDVLHVGHLKYFEFAKKVCTHPSKLIVSITNDYFVKLNKGINRPYFNQKLRAEFLTHLKDIDYVLISNRKNALDIINLVKPNFYVKGPDYRLSKKNKSDINLQKEISLTKKYGGKFILSKGITFSSSNIINYHYKEYNEAQRRFLNNLKNKFSQEYLNNIFDNLRKPKLLIIGESIIDEYVFTDTLGKSSKESILNSKILNTKKYLGGCLAVANNCVDFVKDIKLITYLGSGDKNNRFIKTNLNKKIKLDFIYKENSPTINKKRYLDNYTKTKLFGSYNLNDQIINVSEENKLIKKIKKNIKNYDIVLVVNYNHGLLTKKLIEYLKKYAKYLVLNNQLNSSNVNTYNLNSFNKSDLLCIQEMEARSALRDKETNTFTLTNELFKKNKHKNVILTSGKNGSFFKNKFIKGNCPAFAGNVVDRVGAGDMFFSTSSILLWNKVPIEITNFISNIASSLKIRNIGHSYKLKFSDLKNEYKNILK